MAKILSDRLKKARELYGPHNTLAVNIGISASTLQTCIQGDEPRQRRIIQAIEKYLAGKGL